MPSISVRQSIVTLSVLLSVVTLFHILVMAGVIPFAYIWGGKLTSKEEMLTFESVSVLINLFIIAIMLLKGNFIPNQLPVKWINAMIWLFVIVFSLNTIGNFFAESSLEMIVGSVVTFISALLCYRIVKG
jgi:hypothetical protein